MRFAAAVRLDQSGVARRRSARGQGPHQCDHPGPSRGLPSRFRSLRRGHARPRVPKPDSGRDEAWLSNSRRRNDFGPDAGRVGRTMARHPDVSTRRRGSTLPTKNSNHQQLGAPKSLQVHPLNPGSERRWFHAEHRRRSVGAVELSLALFDGSHEVLLLATFELRF